MHRTLLVTTLVTLLLAQQYLPKQGKLPMTDIFSYRITRSGDTDFILGIYDEKAYSTVISSYPVRPNAVTSVTFMLVKGNRMIFGCGKGHMSDIINSQYVGQLPQTVGYFPWTGDKINNLV